MSRVVSHSRKEPPAEGENPVPLREHTWGNRSSSSVGGGGEDPTDPESGKPHPRRPHSLCKMLAACFKVVDAGSLLRIHIDLSQLVRLSVCRTFFRGLGLIQILPLH